MPSSYSLIQNIKAPLCNGLHELWILVSFHQEGVQMVTSDFVVVQPVTKVELKSATITHGALCVMIPGAHLMQEWFADSLDFHQ